MSIVFPFVLEFPYTFPITFGAVNGAVQIEDYDPVYFLQPALNAHTAIANMPYFFLQLFDRHFGPDAVDSGAQGAAFDILEGSADFELRTPEPV